MIVTTRFDGDTGDYIDQVQWAQHDVYHDALRIIVRNCMGQAKLAHMVLYDDWRERWNPSDGFDHRTLQVAHDILAAVWRRHAFATRLVPLPFDGRQFPLPFEDVWDGDGPNFAERWLKWLEDEVKSWNYVNFWIWDSDDHNARLIRLVVRILENQNIPVGYRAETELAWELISKFQYVVPWERNFADAARSAYEALEG